MNEEVVSDPSAIREYPELVCGKPGCENATVIIRDAYNGVMCPKCGRKAYGTSLASAIKTWKADNKRLELTAAAEFAGTKYQPDKGKVLPKSDRNKVKKERAR